MPKTKSKDSNVKDEFKLEPAVKHQLADASFVLFIFLSFFLLLSLISHRVNTMPFHGGNAGGKVGERIAELSFNAIGLGAFCLPFLLAWGAWYVFKAKKTEPQSTQAIVVKIIGCIPLLIGIVTMLTLSSSHNSTLHFGVGGLSGQVLTSYLEASFNLVGAYLVSLGLLCIGLSLVFSVNWLLTCERIGLITVKFIFKKMLHFTALISKKIKQSTKQVQLALKDKKDANLNVPTLHTREDSRVAAQKVVLEEPVKEESIDPFFSAPKTITKSAVLINKPHKPESKKIKKVFAKGRANLPSFQLLDKLERSTNLQLNNKDLENVSREVEQRLLDFGVDVQVVAVHPGPVITRFELQLAPGIKVSKITGLAKDLARSLSVNSVRVVEVIPGKSVVGLELPNQCREMVGLKEVLISDKFRDSQYSLCLALGVDISGVPMFVDLAKMPHLLVAGTTGSGKSVGINAMILSLLFKCTPEDVRLILVDPKMLELSIYEGVPHLLTPVVTDMKDAANALRWSVAEMEKRYRLMAALGVRNIKSYNKKVKEAKASGAPIPCPLASAGEQQEESFLEPLPYIVIIIDELADMMMVVGKKVEQLIARIAQKARAAGIHLVLATQRPSVDVLTGLIKSNIPTRISFQVSSKIDSRTILDQQGAEQLLGQGDLLYLAPGTGTPIRVHGAFVDDKEVHRVVGAWKKLGEPEYISEVTSITEEAGVVLSGEEVEDSDPLFDEACAFVTQTRKASISSVQRRFKIGYNRAARLVEEMERIGLVSPMEQGGAREVLAPVPTEDS